MLKNIEDISATKKRITIEIPAEAMEAEMLASIGKLKSRAKIPGFRPGKVPTSMIEKKFGKELEGELLEKMIPEYFSLAVKEMKVTPVSSPTMETGGDWTRNTPFVMTLLLEIRPEIIDLKYEKVQVKKIVAEIGDSDIDLTLKRLQEDKATFTPYDGPVAESDLITMDYDITGTDKSLKDESFKVGSDLMPKAFSENVTGMKKGDKKDFEVEFPADYYSRDLAGQKQTFHVTINEIKSMKLPATDDEFAKDLGYDTLAALKDKIRERLLLSKEKAAGQLMRAEIVRKLLDSHTFEVPESLMARELDGMVGAAISQGRKDAESALMAEFRPVAERNVKASILVQVIGERENLDVTEDDIRKKIALLAAETRLSEENIMKYYASRDGSFDGLRNSIYEDKVLDFLLSRAEFVEGEKI